jgi:hypothetical protein
MPLVINQLSNIYILSSELVAHAYNLNYSGGRDQEDHGSKPAWVNSFTRHYLEKTLHKKGLVSDWED